MNGIAFGQSTFAQFIKSRHSFDIVYTIEDNIFNSDMVQLQIEGIHTPEQNTEGKLCQ